MSVRLEDYRETIHVSRGRGLAREALEGCWAYRMDGAEDAGAGTPDMRADAGLDGLSCCDYLRMDDKVILIEETEMAKTMLQIERDLERVGGGRELRRNFIRDTVRERVVRENCLKVYGSLLLMCRLKLRREDMRHVVWLVVSGEAGATEAIRRMDPEKELEGALVSALCGGPGRQSSLQGGLRSAKLVDQTELITSAELRRRLTGRSAGRP